MNKTKFTKKLVLNDPLVIPLILKRKDFNEKITKGIMYKMIPFRSSIEIEANGTLDNLINESNIDILSYEESTLLENEYEYEEGTEFKISIKNYEQIIGLYQILELLKKNCSLNTQSGIHIHINLGKKYVDIIYNTGHRILYNLEKFFSPEYYLNIHKLDNYKGKYNKNLVGYNNKNCKININSLFYSIEFRTFPMTFEYKEIIKWIVELNQVVKRFQKYLDSF
jgi:hypothetical protein